MPLTPAIDSQHGVMFYYQNKGIFVYGEAGIGKSSLALELIHHGAILIADDVVDFAVQDNQLMAHCPAMLSGLLHTRELGLMDVRKVYGDNCWRSSSVADFCIELKQHYHPEVALSSPCTTRDILDTKLVVLTLSVNNAAPLKSRIDCWLAMQNVHADNLGKMQHWQQNKMAF